MVLLIAALALVGQSRATCCQPDLMAKFADDPAFAAFHAAPLPLNFKAETGKAVTFKTDGAKAGGFYVPPTGRSHSAIILVHEYWGLNDYIKREAERLNSATGYAVLAIDLYDGKIATDSQTASKYMQAADTVRCLAIADGAIHALKVGTFVFKPKTIGTVGYCFGGGWSERTAVDGGKNVQACVVYYGMPDISTAAMAKLRAPVLMFEGKQDQWINDKVVADFAEAMKKAGHSFESHAYDAPHAFANPSNPRYNKEAAKDSMKRELAFFKAHL